jgi:hypothetical protein
MVKKLLAQSQLASYPVEQLASVHDTHTPEFKAGSDEGGERKGREIESLFNE